MGIISDLVERYEKDKEYNEAYEAKVKAATLRRSDFDKKEGSFVLRMDSHQNGLYFTKVIEGYPFLGELAYKQEFLCLPDTWKVFSTFYFNMSPLEDIEIAFNHDVFRSLGAYVVCFKCAPYKGGKWYALNIEYVRVFRSNTDILTFYAKRRYKKKEEEERSK
jgi:hypothetical protein